MNLTLVTAPTQEPITLDEAKSHLHLDADDEDDLVSSLIVVARQWIEGQTRRALYAQTWTLDIDDGWPWIELPSGYRFRIILPLNPLISVSSITYNDGSSPLSTLASSQYTVVARKYGSFIAPAYGVTWPAVRCVPNAVSVRFIAGDGDPPKPLVHAMKLLVSHLFENRDVVSAQDLREVPYSIEALVSPYRPGRIP